MSKISFLSGKLTKNVNNVEGIDEQEGGLGTEELRIKPSSCLVLVAVVQVLSSR